MPKRRALARLFAAFAAFCALLAVYAVAVEPSRLTVNRQELTIPKWPSALSGLRVALLSDFHIGSPFWDLPRLVQLVTRVNSERPDLVLLAGDYLTDGMIGGTIVPAEPIAAELGHLRAPLGVVAVLGNHDGWHDGKHMRSALQGNGITVLEDEVLRVAARGTTFYVLGMADEEIRTQSAKQALDLAPPGVPLLALVHEPDIFTEMDARASLVIAGHTHGGQVKLPILGRLVVPSRYGQRFAAGHVVEGQRHLFVTTGLGTSILPVRFGVPPEVALLTLRAEE